MTARTSSLQLLAWSASEPGVLAGISSSGRFTLWNVKHMLATGNCPKLSELEEDLTEDDHAMFGAPRESYNTPFSLHELGYPVSQVQLLGRAGIVVLPREGTTIYFYTFSQDADSLTELWRLSLDSAIDCFTLRSTGNGAMQVVACLSEEIQTYKIPLPVLDGMRWSQNQSVRNSLTSQARLNEQPAGHPATIKPERVRRQMSNKKSIASTPKKARAGITSPEPRSPASKTGRRYSHNKKDSATANRAMTSSLELPKKQKLSQKEEQSPMPFLSPSIPARRDDLSTLPPLDDVLHLPPLARASFDSLTSSATHDHDSDSDDDTFAGNMRSSGSLLPGGVNIPLPRTCGAMFGMNGQLITFFPSRKIASTAIDEAEVVEPASHGGHFSEASQLFPSFGNIAAIPHIRGDSYSDGLEPWESGFGDAPKSAFEPASYETRPSWKARFSPTKPDRSPLSGHNAVYIAVRDVEILLPSRKSLAEQYRLVGEAEDPSIREAEDHNSELCLENAKSAAAADLCEVADSWNLLALLLEQKPALGVELSDMRASESRQMSGKRPPPSTKPSLALKGNRGLEQIPQSRMQWRDRPFAHGWATEKILDWAESRADLQTLACTSALVTKSFESSSASQRGLSVPRFDVLGGELGGLALDDIHAVPPTSSSSPGGLYRVDESPLRLLGSHNSSREPSQPTTPYLDSSVSTPPLSFSALQRQSLGLSASGSASPEHQRGSFSAAAKYYAQSITDKIAAYGSSPPARKSGTSPANELSSSLPVPAGSWSKSVSFASTTDASKSERRHMSLGQADEEYDSDKTIDDADRPHSPRLPSNQVSFQVNQEAVFFDELGASTELSFSLNSMAQKSRRWCQSYAEQLRSWDLLMEAAELDNISHAGNQNPSRPNSPKSSVIPHRAASQRHTNCSACFCVIHGAEQLCPSCLHATHPKCLEDLIEFIGSEQFECLTGCGCNCAEVAELHFEMLSSGPEIAPQPTSGVFKKKSSFTDPRRLRSRLQGDTW
ncbi:hypothetical protein TI39_contig615g00018 [Zymoseptoria brevis]|uniref:Uncharacterized protein n=1 Tax=Zymoseptoria brevis TaxID=1047168 RepID=A0A0F4GK30_9PEZI|nr:hypothetical protein TI39_contig615g00018 [Zymoseptoria brevis]